jgi:hypothetical protein
MQSLKMVGVETTAQFLSDNLINIFLMYLACNFFNVSLTTTTSLWVIGQSLNLFKTFLIRYHFNKKTV